MQKRPAIIVVGARSFSWAIGDARYGGGSAVFLMFTLLPCVGLSNGVK